MLDSKIQHRDVILHDKIEEDGEIKEGIIYPVTRYDNILNSPKVVFDITSANNPPFLLVVSEESTMEDDEVFNLITNGIPW